MMTEILSDFSSAAMRRAVKANLYSLFRMISQSKHVTSGPTPSLIRWHTRIPHPWFNGVISTQPASETDENIVQDVIAYFQSRGVSVFSWWLDPALEKTDWESRLLPHGFQFTDDTPGMAAEIDKLNRNFTTPQNFEIKRATNDAMLREWVHTLVIGYGLPETWEGDYYQMLLEFGLDWPNQYYIGYLNGNPVATSNAILGAGVAGVMSVSTLPEARGQGIGAAMSLVPLTDAEKLGYRIGVLQSSDMGYKVYQRLGFQHVCQMEHFYWTDETHNHE